MGPAYRAVLRVFSANRWLLGASFGLSIVGALLVVAYPWLSKLQIDALEGDLGFMETPTGLFVLAVGLLLASNLVNAAISSFGRILDTVLRERMDVETDRLLFEKMEELDAGFLENPKNRRLIYIFFDISGLPQSLLELAGSAVRVGVSVLGILPIIAVSDLNVFFIIAGASVLQLAVLRIQVRRENAYRIYKERAVAGVNELIFLLRYYFHQLLGATGEDRIMPQFWSKRREAVKLETRQARITAGFVFLDQVVGHLALTGATVVIGLRALAGDTTVGTFVMVTLYAAQLQSNLTTINLNVGEWYRLKAVMVQLGFFLGMKPQVDTSASTTPEAPLEGDVRLEGVHFRYPTLGQGEQDYLGHMIDALKLGHAKREVWPADYELVREWEQLLEDNRTPREPVLKGVDCAFERGKVTALVGRNGSGKTTLMKLLVRSYDPERGVIRVADGELPRIMPRYLRHLFSMVTQTPFLVESFSVRDNALLGCPSERSDDDVWEVLEQIGLADAVRKLAGGLDSLVGDEVVLSGGQEQLLVIARTLLQRRPYVILDEGTNQLDAEHELAIMSRLHQLKQDATVIMITHRMTTARKADRILVLDEGRIVEEGTHEELVARESGLYRKFWEIQVVD